MRFALLLTTLLFCSCVDQGPEPSSSTQESSPTSPDATEPPIPPGSEGSAEPSETRNEKNVTVSSPVEGSVIRENPVRVEGTARTFENNVVLQVLDADGRQILQTSTTARGELGQFNPWSEELWLTEWPGGHMTIRAIEHSARDGSIRSLASVRVENGLERREVTLHFPNSRNSPNDCSRMYPVTHTVPNTIAMARLLAEALIAGPTDSEKGQGFSSQIPRGTRVSSVDLDGSTITIDFSPEMQNIGGSCRVQAIRASIERTLMELPNVNRVRITAAGSEELALQP